MDVRSVCSMLVKSEKRGDGQQSQLRSAVQIVLEFDRQVQIQIQIY